MNKLIFLSLGFLISINVLGQTIDLNELDSPILFKGDSVTAYRDPAVLFENGTFHLFFTVFYIKSDGKIFGYTANSNSRDLKHWSEPVRLTPEDQDLTYSSPGNVIKVGDEWILCLQTYPRPGYTVDQVPRYGDQSSRIFMMRSKDLKHWSEPELLKVKGPDVPVNEMGRMIDPYLIEDHDQKGKYWCFYKQNGVSMSWSYDLKNWTYEGHTDSGENVSVLYEDGAYILFHSPENGIGIKKSTELVHWKDCGKLITLGQKEWAWAEGRLTAGTVLDMSGCSGLPKYIMFFHGEEPDGFDKNASIGIAWSDDLIHWEWPK